MGRLETKRTSALRATGLPKNVRLLHLTIRLIEGGTSDNDSLGEWHAAKAEIHYDPNATLPVLQETIVHEILHAICDHTGLDPDDHETIIRSISPLILHVLRHNPKLREWLVQ
jgi:hypothetical protein